MRFSIAATTAFFVAGAIAKPESDCTTLTSETVSAHTIQVPVSSATPTPSAVSSPVTSAVATPSVSPSPATPHGVVTEVVTDFTTFCPAATTLTVGTQTLTVTEPTTLTVPGKVSVTRPVYYSTSTVCNACAASPSNGYFTPSGSPIYPITSATASASPTPSGPETPFNNGASRVTGAGAGLAALLGVAVFLL